MKLNFKNLPVENLPYTNITLCKQMMLKLYENIPYLAELPNMDANDNINTRTFDKLPGITIKEKKLIILDSDSADFQGIAKDIDKQYNTMTPENLEKYSYTSPYFELYLEMLKRIKPEHTVIKLLGLFSFADTIFNQNTGVLLTDRYYRKYLAQLITLKAMWFIKKIKEASPDTKPIILFDEPYLYKFGSLKRTNEEITNETIITLFERVFSKLQKAGAFVGVQSFEKCNWMLVLDADVDLISFDAYNNSGSLNIIADRINEFLAKGGYINWGIVPVSNEKNIKVLNFNTVFNKFIKATEELNSAGVSLDLIYKHCTVSTQGNLANLPILFAEKALIICNQLAKKIPESSAI